MIDDPGNTIPLDAFWEKHRREADAKDIHEEAHSPTGYQKPRGLSISTLGTGTPHLALPTHHPALALPEILTTFGPLVFPLIRCALLQKRILILGEAPVEQMCDMVYNFSILSTLAKSTEELLPQSSSGRHKCRPLFNIGIADIPYLETLKHPWIACSTDDVLATKPKLFDVLVIMPSSMTGQKTGNKTYSKIILSSPELMKAFPRDSVKATQRDARRFVSLKQSLQRLESGAEIPDLSNRDDDTSSIASGASEIADRREAVEPLPWSVIAYTSLIWWASAGDRRSGLMEAEELANEQDEALLHDVLAEAGTTKEVAVVAYFHKLSSLLLSVMSNAVERSQRVADRYHDEDRDDNADNDDQALLQTDRTKTTEPVSVNEEDIRTMGLDIWSESDKQFISQMIEHWWDREAIVEKGTVECCGIKII